jgi:uncharacterized NAD(P)/FAD-binding protein YdhS
MARKRDIGIVGLGPRGSWALENFVIELHRQNQLTDIQLLLFEKSNHHGNGHVYATNQIESNWINICERILHLDKRAEINLSTCLIPSFPSYHIWANLNYDIISKKQPDTYPPRAKLGIYLSQRFESFIDPLLSAKIAIIYKEKVEEVLVNKDNKIQINTNLHSYKDIDEVLLTIGHQTTVLDNQLADWEKFAAGKPALTHYISPYPIDQFLHSDKLTDSSSVGIRGFGLSMIDVARAIANKFGKFVTHDAYTKSCSYVTTNDLDRMIVPFSLDGLPPVPKPISAHIDNWYKPSSQQLIDFESKIGNALTQQQACNSDFLIKAFAPIAAEVYINLHQTYSQDQYSANELEHVITEWLRDNNYNHATILSTNHDVVKSIQDHVAMALGQQDISLDYCVGQVWRYCQPSIYKQLSYNACKEEVIADIIALEESTKRYSYGPPVESMQQMLALIDAGVMTMDMVDNPDFKLTEKGWCFSKDDKTITVGIMINSVLSPPQIKSVNSPIVKNMLSDDLIEAVHDDLGVSTDESGYLISSEHNNKAPIALLGRLAKGTIIGVDAILECFGDRPQKWAIEAANRHVNRVI